MISAIMILVKAVLIGIAFANLSLGIKNPNKIVSAFSYFVFGFCLTVGVIVGNNLL
jgi:hypothetical protein